MKSHAMHYQFPFNQACTILLTQQYCVGGRIYQYVKSFECIMWLCIKKLLLHHTTKKNTKNNKI